MFIFLDNKLNDRDGKHIAEGLSVSNGILIMKEQFIVWKRWNNPGGGGCLLLAPLSSSSSNFYIIENP